MECKGFHQLKSAITGLRIMKYSFHVTTGTSATFPKRIMPGKFRHIVTSENINLSRVYYFTRRTYYSELLYSLVKLMLQYTYCKQYCKILNKSYFI